MCVEPESGPEPYEDYPDRGEEGDPMHITDPLVYGTIAYAIGFVLSYEIFYRAFAEKSSDAPVVFSVLIFCLVWPLIFLAVVAHHMTDDTDGV